jgi:hypothetical protein
MYKLNSVLVVAGITTLFLVTIAFAVWGGYGKACGSKGQTCGTAGSAAVCAMQGAGGAKPEASAAGSTAACAMHGGSAACAVQGGSAAGSTDKGQGSSGFLRPYFEIRSLLAQDKVKGLDKLSKSLANDTSKFRKKLASSSKDKVAAEQITEQLDALKNIETAASAMETGNLESARESFKGLSRNVLNYVKSYGCGGPVYSFYCDMVKESWLQETDKIGNPYYGSKMLKCGVMSGHTMDGKYMSGAHDVMGGKNTAEKQEPMDMGHMNH